MLRLPLLCFIAVTIGCASTRAWEPAAASSPYEAAERASGGVGDDDGRFEVQNDAALATAPGVFESLFGDDAKTAGPPPPPPPPTAPALDPVEAPPEHKPIEAAKRLVIYTGSMALLVPSTDVAIVDFLRQVERTGGFLQARATTTVTVRVPAAQFFPTLDLLRKTGTVTDEKINAADVTKKVFDIELRLQTADESRKRLLKILESASRIEDILAIEAQVRRLTEEIELMKGELRTLGDQIAFSTLTVSFFANAPSPRPYPDRSRSRFEWINQVGVEQVLYGF